MSALVGSRLPVGSSQRSAAGRVARARQAATRWRSPCERAAGLRSSSAATPAAVASRSASISRARASMPVSSRLARVMFSRTVRYSRSSNSWKTMPTRRRRRRRRCEAGRRVRSSPARRTEPESERSTPPASRSRVDLPEPLGPIRATRSPGETVNAGTWRAKPPDAAYANRTSWNSITCRASMTGPERGRRALAAHRTRSSDPVRSWRPVRGWGCDAGRSWRPR